MKIHRFYIPKGTLAEEISSNKEVTVTDEHLIHQWTKVLRFEVDDTCVVFCGDGKEFLARFVSLEKKKAILQIEESASHPQVGAQVALVSSVIRKERYEWLVEKGTELGVSEFYPIISARSEKKLYNPERLEKISIEAVEQSGRLFVPRIHQIGELEEVLNQLVVGGYQICVLDFEGEEPISTFQNLKQEKIAFVVGPEGGWALEDQAAFASLPHKKISFGKFTLRAETAGIVVASIALATNYQG